MASTTHVPVYLVGGNLETLIKFQDTLRDQGYKETEQPFEITVLDRFRKLTDIKVKRFIFVFPYNARAIISDESHPATSLHRELKEADSNGSFRMISANLFAMHAFCYFPGFIVIYNEKGAPQSQMFDEDVTRLYEVGEQTELKKYAENRLMSLSMKDGKLNEHQLRALREFVEGGRGTEVHFGIMYYTHKLGWLLDQKVS
jgi:hypothetical protein